MESFDYGNDSLSLTRLQEQLDLRNSRHAKSRQNLTEECVPTPSKIRKTSVLSALRNQSSFNATRDDSVQIEKLKGTVSQYEADNVSLKAKIIKMGNTIGSLEVKMRESVIKHDEERGKMKTIRDREVVKSNELHSKLQYLMEKERNAREELQNASKKCDMQKLEMDKQVLKLQREKIEDKDNMQQMRAKWLETESELRAENSNQMKEIIFLKSSYDEAKAQLELSKRTQEDSTQQNSKVQELLAQLQEEKTKNKELNQQLSEHEDNIVVTKMFKADLDQVPKMKSELEKLRVDIELLRHNEQNTFLLEEKLRSKKKQLETAEEHCEKYTELEIANEELTGRLQRWEAHDTSGSRRPQSPSSLSRKVKELEMTNVMMLAKEGELETSLHSKSIRLEDVQGQLLKIAADLSSEKVQNTQLHDDIKRLRRKLLLVSKERDSFKSILDSYESETTVVNADQQSQVTKLREILQECHGQIERLESEAEAMSRQLVEVSSKYEKAKHQLQQSDQVAPQCTSSRQDQDTIMKLKEQVAVLDSELLKTKEERDVLEARIEQRHIQGEYDPSKTKILHLTINPCSVAQEARESELEKLKEERDKLKKRNEILEENGGNVEDLTMQVQEQIALPSPSKQLEEVKGFLKKEEMKNKRLVEVFQKTSQDFREFCYQLTGFKIDLSFSKQCKVTSMYAESPKDFLLFQQNDRGEIQLLQTDYSGRLTDAVKTHLQEQNSIPMFLSSLTMDLFSKQTMVM